MCRTAGKRTRGCLVYFCILHSIEFSGEMIYTIFLDGFCEKCTREPSLSPCNRRCLPLNSVLGRPHWTTRLIGFFAAENYEKFKPHNPLIINSLLTRTNSMKFPNKMLFFIGPMPKCRRQRQLERQRQLQYEIYTHTSEVVTLKIIFFLHFPTTTSHHRLLIVSLLHFTQLLTANITIRRHDTAEWRCGWQTVV